MKTLNKIFLFCVTFLVSQAIFAAGAASPVGYWKTIDDVTGQPKAIIQITIIKNTLYGKIVKRFMTSDSKVLCEACQGSLHNKPILGMTVVRNLKQSTQNPNIWANGEILDPKNGKVYRAYLQVSDNGQQLEVRGYIGMPLFGRSQTWIRVGGSR